MIPAFDGPPIVVVGIGNSRYVVRSPGSCPLCGLDRCVQRRNIGALTAHPEPGGEDHSRRRADLAVDGVDAESRPAPPWPRRS